MIRTKVDEMIMQYIEAIADWEKKIKQSETDLTTIRAQVESTKKQVDLAEKGVKEKEASLATAEDAVRAAEKAINDGVNCNLKRRRRQQLFS
ncbi:unnamed protein product, partial [Rotaria sp. Silwood2]